MRRTCTALAVVLGVTGVVLGSAQDVGAAPAQVPVQVLAINDLHGRLTLPVNPAESRLVTGPGPDGVYGVAEGTPSDDEVLQVGGAYNMAASVRQLRAEFREEAGDSAASFTVSAGDLVDQSPDDYQDEPTVEMVNALGVDVSAVGDDELHRGTRELRRISAATDGQYTDDVEACDIPAPGVDGCFGRDEHAFTGATFPYLAANVVSRRTGEPMLPPYAVLDTAEGARVAFVGVISRAATVNLPAEGVADVDVLDEVETANRWADELQREGIQAIGLLIHEGGGQRGGEGPPDPNACDGLTGPIVGISRQIDPAVDFIVSGHKHASFNCLLPSPDGSSRLVTQAGAYGRMVTDIRLTLDPASGDVLRDGTYSATNVPSRRSTSPDEPLQEILRYWAAGPGDQRTDAPTGDPARAETPDGTSAAGGGLQVVAVSLVALAVVALVALVLGVRSTRSRAWRRRNRRPRWTLGS